MIKVYHNCAAGGTFPVSGVSNLNLNTIGYGDRWVISGFGWLNVFTGLDMNYRVIVQRKYNPASACYEITMRYKDICHRLDGSNGKYKKTFSNGQTKIISNDPGFVYFTDNQTYKGDILITIVKNGYDASGNMIVDNAYNITVWQEKNGAKTLISYIRLTTDSVLTTRTYALDDYGHNILTPNTEANETDAYGKAFTETVNVNETRPIKKLNSSTGTSNQSGQSAWKKLDTIMTNIASYGYINCSTPLSEYKNILRNFSIILIYISFCLNVINGCINVYKMNKFIYTWSIKANIPLLIISIILLLLSFNRKISEEVEKRFFI